MLVLAALTWWRWHFVSTTQAFDNTIALMIATCPCALALATPLAITVAIGRAARRGILVKGGDALEALARPATLVLDKTGTLTEGRIALTAWEGSDASRRLLLALERHSSHPIAAGFAAAWPDVDVPVATDVRATTGGGLAGTVEGHAVRVGSPAFVLEGARDGRGLVSGPGDVTLTPVLLAVDGEVVARAGMGDRLRPDAEATLAELRASGWKLRLLSGDAPAVVAAVGARLGFAPGECRGGASPEDKLAEIESLARTGTWPVSYTHLTLPTSDLV